MTDVLAADWEKGVDLALSIKLKERASPVKAACGGLMHVGEQTPTHINSCLVNVNF